MNWYEMELRRLQVVCSLIQKEIDNTNNLARKEVYRKKQEKYQEAIKQHLKNNIDL